MSQTIFSLFEKIFNAMDILVYLIISLSLVAFLWGVLKLAFNTGNTNARKEAKSYMIYGIITLFVMTSLWGIIYLLKGFVESDAGFGDVNYGQDQIIDPGTQNPPLQDIDDLFDNNPDQGMV